MKRSTDRILTTHTGSLPRPWDLVDLLITKESGQVADRAAFDRRVSEAVTEVVKKQTEVGVDVLNDEKTSLLAAIAGLARPPESTQPSNRKLSGPKRKQWLMAHAWPCSGCGSRSQPEP